MTRPQRAPIVFNQFAHAHPLLTATCYMIAMPVLMCITIYFDSNRQIPNIAAYQSEFLFVTISAVISASSYLIYHRFKKRWISKPYLALGLTLMLMTFDLMKHFDSTYRGQLSHYFIFQPKGIVFFVGVFLVLTMIAFFAPKKDDL